MDFLNPIAAQIRELFASMTPGARVTAGLLLAVVAVSVGFLFQRVAAGPDEYLFGGEPIGSRLPRMESAMADADVEFVTEGTRIRVARGDKNRAIAAIAAAGELPPDFHRLMDDAINGGSLFDFRETKLQRMRAAREAQTSLVLSEFPWVEKANVIFNDRQEQGLRGTRRATAAVSVLPAVGEQLTGQRTRTVKDYVSKACDVPIEDVVVTSLGGDSFAADGGVDPEEYEHPLDRLRAREAKRIERAILQQLVDIRGVRVAVNPRLDSTSEQRVVELAPQGEPVALARTTTNEEDTHTTGGEGERVGLEANGPEGLGRDEQIARQEQSRKKSDSTEVSNGVGTRRTETITAGFALKEAEASVVVPMSSVRAMYVERNRKPDGSEPEEVTPEALEQFRAEVKTDIESIVKPLLPKLQLGENQFKQVSVTFVTDLPPAELPEPSVAAGALGWVGSHADTLAMAGLAVVGLVMLRSMVNAAPKDRPASAVPALQLDGQRLEDAPEANEDEGQRPKLKLRKADTLKDDLSEMVASDPDAAAAILRAWINNAA